MAIPPYSGFWKYRVAFSPYQILWADLYTDISISGIKPTVPAQQT
jgi:hypothetical protein